ncbi:glucosamine--fructose-6-phosphate aminotransferase [bacterium]|nr:glucosamine--fructose-6-phosphate aminotransferase [bacterium]
MKNLKIDIKCQLTAYYIAKMNGCDIDKPKNLAKKCNS